MKRGLLIIFMLGIFTSSITLADNKTKSIYLPALQKEGKVLYLLNDTANPTSQTLASVAIKKGENTRILSKYQINNMGFARVHVTLTPIVENKEIKEGINTYHLGRKENILVAFNLDPHTYKNRTDRIAKIECRVADPKSKKMTQQDCIDAVLVTFDSAKLVHNVR